MVDQQIQGESPGAPEGWLIQEILSHSMKKRNGLRR